MRFSSKWLMVLLALAVLVVLTPEAASAATIQDEDAGFWACLACAVGAGFLTATGGLAALYAWFGTGQGAVIGGICYLECKELYERWVGEN